MDKGRGFVKIPGKEEQLLSWPEEHTKPPAGGLFGNVRADDDEPLAGVVGSPEKWRYVPGKTAKKDEGGETSKSCKELNWRCSSSVVEISTVYTQGDEKIMSSRLQCSKQI